MTLSAQAAQELLRVQVSRSSARQAEAATMLRFAGLIDATDQGLRLEAEFSSRPVAMRLDALLNELFDVSTAIHTIGPGGRSKEPHHYVHVLQGAEDVVRRLGLVTRSGTRVVGLPPQVVSGQIVDAEAAWRGAFLSRGVLSEPGRTNQLEVASPCAEAALAMVGCARRLGVAAKTKETRGVDRVVVRDGDGVGALLSRMGAQRTRILWDEKRRQREDNEPENRLANFDDANLRRSARAAVAAAARVERAMDILGDDVPEHLAEAGWLRCQHRQASLEELGRMAEPPLTKDAVAGRIRRLLSMADKRAEETGQPDTNAAITDEI